MSGSTNQDFDTFIRWETTSRNVVKFKKIYVDMTAQPEPGINQPKQGDLIAGIMLSQIVGKYLPNEDGDSQLDVLRDGHWWIVAPRHNWWEECRVSSIQADRAIKLLVGLGLIEKRLFRFEGAPTVHIRIMPEKFLMVWERVLSLHHYTKILGSAEIQQRSKMDGRQ
jgi:hypothetical protein